MSLLTLHGCLYYISEKLETSYNIYIHRSVLRVDRYILTGNIPSWGYRTAFIYWHVVAGTSGSAHSYGKLDLFSPFKACPTWPYVLSFSPLLCLHLSTISFKSSTMTSCSSFSKYNSSFSLHLQSKSSKSFPVQQLILPFHKIIMLLRANSWSLLKLLRRVKRSTRLLPLLKWCFSSFGAAFRGSSWYRQK